MAIRHIALLVCFVSTWSLSAAIPADGSVAHEISGEDYIEFAEDSHQNAAKAAGSILDKIHSEIMSELRERYHQGLVSWIVAALGAFLIYDGKRVFEYVLTIVAGLVGWYVAMSQMKEMCPDCTPSENYVVAAQIAILFAFASVKGYHGSKLLFGAAFGAVISWMLLSTNSSTHVVILVTSLISMVCVFVFYRFGREYLMPIIAPLLGGSLVSSSLGYTIAWVAKVSGHIREDQHSQYWVDYWLTLLNCKNEGILVGTDYQYSTIINVEIPNDKVGGWLVWILLFAWGLAEYKKHYLEGLYRAVDIDGDGIIDRAEFNQALRDRLIQGRECPKCNHVIVPDWAEAGP